MIVLDALLIYFVGMGIQASFDANKVRYYQNQKIQQAQTMGQNAKGAP